MLMGHADGLSERGSSKDHLLADPESELDDGDVEQILYAASFEELASNYIKYDTIIWVSISLLLVLAWGVGIILLLYLPIKRYVLQKDISSRKLHVTPNEIVYKVYMCMYLWTFVCAFVVCVVNSFLWLFIRGEKKSSMDAVIIVLTIVLSHEGFEAVIHTFLGCSNN